MLQRRRSEIESVCVGVWGWGGGGLMGPVRGASFGIGLKSGV